MNSRSSLLILFCIWPINAFPERLFVKHRSGGKIAVSDAKTETPLQLTALPACESGGTNLVFSCTVRPLLVVVVAALVRQLHEQASSGKGQTKNTTSLGGFSDTLIPFSVSWPPARAISVVSRTADTADNASRPASVLGCEGCSESYPPPRPPFVGSMVTPPLIPVG